MHKFYWNGRQRVPVTPGGPSPLGASGVVVSRGSTAQPSRITSDIYHEVYQTSPSTFVVSSQMASSKSEHNLNYPHVPIRHDAKTIVKVRSNEATSCNAAGNDNSGGRSKDETQHHPTKKKSAPTGSHRVLLKLRKMRPTSVHEASQDFEGLGSSSGGEIADTCSVKSYRCNSQMSSSRSDNFAGYNQTWNERSLRKHSTSNNSHNYENVYSGEDEEWVPPPYENFQLPPKPSKFQQHQHPNYENFPFADCDSIAINSLASSPRSARYSLDDSLDSGCPRTASSPRFIKSTPPPPIPPARRRCRANKDKRSSRALKAETEGCYEEGLSAVYRSKSCERPRVKAAVRDTFKLISNESDKISSNINRFSTNFTGKISASLIARKFNRNTSSSKTSSSDVTKSPHTLSKSVVERSSLEGGGGSSSRQADTGRIDSVSPESSLAERMRQKLTLKIRSKSTERISQRDVVVQASNTGPPASPLSDHMSSDASKSPCNSQQIQTTYHTIPPPPPATEEKQRGAVVEGPFVGRARALVDCFASPYDKDALAFNRGDVIDIISMNASGVWRGHLNGQVGHFKFISVEVMLKNQDNGAVVKRQRRKSTCSRSSRYSGNIEDLVTTSYTSGDGLTVAGGESVGTCDNTNGDESNSDKDILNSHPSKPSPPQSVAEVLTRIGLERLTGVFVLNGFDDLESFREISESDLDFLKVTDATQREKLFVAAEGLADDTTSSVSDNTSHIGDDDSGGGTDQTITPVKTALAQEPGDDLNSPAPGGPVPATMDDEECSRVDSGYYAGSQSDNTVTHPVQSSARVQGHSPTASERSSRCSAGLGSSSNESGIHSNSGSFCEDNTSNAGEEIDELSVAAATSINDETVFDDSLVFKKPTAPEAIITQQSQDKFRNARNVFEKM